MKEKAKEILEQIEAGRWNWVPVKRYESRAYSNVLERHTALNKHHEEETKFMIELIKSLCQEVVNKN